jgi:hypothetical protein
MQAFIASSSSATTAAVLMQQSCDMGIKFISGVAGGIPATWNNNGNTYDFGQYTKVKSRVTDD